MPFDKKDHLEEVYGLIEEDRGEFAKKVSELLIQYRPRVSIDRAFQKELKLTLLEKKKAGFPFTYHLSLTSFYRFGGVFASLIAIFGVWNWYSVGTKSPLLIQNPIIEETSQTVYTEEKAIEVDQIAQEEEVKNIHISGITKKTITRSFPSEEIGQISTEMDTLSSDLLDLVETLGADENRPYIAEMSTLDAMRSIQNIENSQAFGSGKPEASVFSPALSDTQSPISTNTGLTLPTIQDLIAPPPAIESLPEYPASMKIYVKNTPWIEEEILTRSATGMIVKDLSTEKRSTLENRQKARIGERKVISIEMKYHPGEKIVGDNLYYLVPVFELTLMDRSVISLPLIRGFR